MKRCLVKMSLISCCAVMATPALAQSPAPPLRKAATALASKAVVDSTKTQTAAASVRAATPAVVAATITAAGSVILLADGIVANATMAQVQPPADGFVYER